MSTEPKCATCGTALIFASDAPVFDAAYHGHGTGRQFGCPKCKSYTTIGITEWAKICTASAPPSQQENLDR